MNDFENEQIEQTDDSQLPKKVYTYFGALKIETINEPENIPPELVDAYCTQFWSGGWQELLKITDPNGSQAQIGINDPLTMEIAEALGIEYIGSRNAWDWVQELWKTVNASGQIDFQGNRISVFWTREKAQTVLEEFVKPVNEGGYGGEILLLRYPGDNGKILGFTAYTLAPDLETGIALVEKRFGNMQYIDNMRKPRTIENLIKISFPNVNRVGIFLDFAIGADWQGKKLGSILFDIRLVAMLSAIAETNGLELSTSLDRVLYTLKLQKEGQEALPDIIKKLEYIQWWLQSRKTSEELLKKLADTIGYAGDLAQSELQLPDELKKEMLAQALIFGRTLVTQPAQFLGNYEKRGIGNVVAEGVWNPSEVLCATTANQVLESFVQRPVRF